MAKHPKEKAVLWGDQIPLAWKPGVGRLGRYLGHGPPQALDSSHARGSAALAIPKPRLGWGHGRKIRRVFCFPDKLIARAKAGARGGFPGGLAAKSSTVETPS